jgi:hypothetical protein
VVVFLSGVTFAFIEAPALGWSSPAVLDMALAGVTGLAVFLIWEACYVPGAMGAPGRRQTRRWAGLCARIGRGRWPPSVMSARPEGASGLVLRVGPIRAQHSGLCSSQLGLACRAPTQAQTVIAAAILRHLHAVITTGQAWDPATATHGTQHTPQALAA